MKKPGFGLMRLPKKGLFTDIEMCIRDREKAGEKLGYPLKAETDGSGGVKNRLTKKEIEECDGIIVPADRGRRDAQLVGAGGGHRPPGLRLCRALAAGRGVGQDAGDVYKRQR